jgi:hypothetical protein
MNEPLAGVETVPEPRAGNRSRAEARSSSGLVVLYSDGADRAGAWIPVPASDRNRAYILGRGPAQPDDEHARLALFRQRPHASTRFPPFASRALSRAQLLVRATPAGALHLANTGRCRLFVNGVETGETEVRPGDVVDVGSQLVLLVGRRPAELPGSRPHPDHRFGDGDPHGLVGESPAAWQLRAQIAFMAPRGSPVLVLGAPGTGKRLVAGALHTLSGCAGPFVAHHAASLESAAGQPDPFGAAAGGTLFIDQLDELPPAAQAQLLRALDPGEHQRLGEATSRRPRFRLIGATTKGVASLRPDLLARFDCRLTVPDLGPRREDIPFIARRLFHGMAAEAAGACARFAGDDGAPRISAAFMSRLGRHAFTAGVRELRALLWRSLMESTGAELEWPAGAGAPPR